MSSRHFTALSFLLMALVLPHEPQAIIAPTEPVSIDSESEAELRLAVRDLSEGASIMTIDVSRIVGDVKLRATIDLEPFESSSEFSRYLTVYCAKYYSPWICKRTEQNMTLQLPTGVQTVHVDPNLDSSVVLEIAKFVKGKPIIEVDGEERTLSDSDVQFLGQVRRLERWQYEVSAGDGSSRYYLIRIERRLFSWPLGSLRVVGISTVIM